MTTTADIANRIASVLELSDIPLADRKKVIGRGTLTIVCEDEQDRVKIYTIDDRKFEWLRKVFDDKIQWIGDKELRDNPRYPGVDRIMQIFSMPRLYPISAQNKKALNALLKDVSRWQDAARRTNQKMGISARMHDAYLKLFNDEHKFWTLLNFILENLDDDFILDIHRGNIMEDKEGELYIIDPVIRRTVLNLIHQSKRIQYVQRQLRQEAKLGIRRQYYSAANRVVPEMDVATIVTPKGFTTYRYTGAKGIMFETKSIEPSVVRHKGILHIKPAGKDGWSLVRVGKETRTHLVTTRTLNRILRSCKIYIAANEVSTPGQKSAPHLMSSREVLANNGKSLTITAKNTAWHILSAWIALHVGVKPLARRLQLAARYIGAKTQITVSSKTYDEATLMDIGLGIVTLRKLFGTEVLKKFDEEIARALVTAIRKPKTLLPPELRKLMIYHDRKWAFDGQRYRAVKSK